MINHGSHKKQLSSNEKSVSNEDITSMGDQSRMLKTTYILQKDEMQLRNSQQASNFLKNRRNLHSSYQASTRNRNIRKSVRLNKELPEMNNILTTSFQGKLSVRNHIIHSNRRLDTSEDKPSFTVKNQNTDTISQDRPKLLTTNFVTASSPSVERTKKVYHSNNFYGTDLPPQLSSRQPKTAGLFNPRIVSQSNTIQMVSNIRIPGEEQSGKHVLTNVQSSTKFEHLPI